MIERMLEPDFGFLIGAVTLGGLDLRDETFEHKGFLVDQLKEVFVDLKDPAKELKSGSC